VLGEDSPPTLDEPLPGASNEIEFDCWRSKFEHHHRLTNQPTKENAEANHL
jgi:hypothetical protein